MPKTLPKHSFYEIALQGPVPAAENLALARAFFRRAGFQPQELVYFDAKGKFRLCVYTRSPQKVRLAERRYVRERVPALRFKTNFLGQKDWLDKWRLDYRVRPLGEQCVLVPQNHREKYRPGKRLPIFLEPHAAFGTGTHATTQMMIRLLETLRGKFTHFMDAGTGTGILSVVAWRLGAQSIFGLDVESHAVQTARENLRLNGCQQAQFQRTSLGQLKTKAHFDLVAANLMTNVLIRDRLILSRLVRKGGYLAVSGISRPHFEGFKKAFTQPLVPREQVQSQRGIGKPRLGQVRLRCRRILKEKGWVALLYQRAK